MTYKGDTINGKPTFALVECYIAERGMFCNAQECYDYWESKNWLTKKGVEPKTLEAAIASYNNIALNKFIKEAQKNRKPQQKKATRAQNVVKSEVTEYEAWTDGSCNNLSPYGEGGSAYVILKNGLLVHEAKYGCIGTSNNRMEMLAIISAINWIPEGSSITIYSDSQYAINVFSGKWKAKSNTDLVRLYDTVAARVSKICFKWVKGHAGTKWNEYVDQLASSETIRMAEKYNIPMYSASNSPKCK
jgi:ribonuclease HI